MGKEDKEISNFVSTSMFQTTSFQSEDLSHISLYLSASTIQHKWNSDQLGVFFRRKGLGQYSVTLNKHKITGQCAPLLEDSDLKDMGINVVGDRLMFRYHLKLLSRKDRFNKRIETLWQGVEQVFFSDYDQAFFVSFLGPLSSLHRLRKSHFTTNNLLCSIQTCSGMCPVDPSTYSLSSNHLRVKRVKPVRCGPVRLCCFGPTYYSNNIDLSKVDDVDVIGIPAPCFQRVCCCTNGKDRVDVESRFERGQKVVLTLPEGQGEVVAQLILNQVEESQKMERGSF
jgi:hypothetical protein